MNPYEVLGVDKHATRPAIRSAYLEKVKQHHADTGDNDVAALQEAVDAWGILSDDVSRKFYDETGATKLDDGVGVRGKVVEAIVTLFDACLKAAVEAQVPMDDVDIMMGMKEVAKRRRDATQEKINQLEATNSEFLKLGKRIKRSDDEPNVFADIVAGTVRQNTEKLEVLRKQSRINYMVVTELDAYTSPVQMAWAVQGMEYGFRPFSRPSFNTDVTT